MIEDLGSWPHPSKIKKLNKTKLMIGVLLSLLPLGLAAGSCWNIVTERRLLARNTPPGSLYQVEGYSMHLNCSGTGSPTILAEAGSDEDSLTWTLIQSSLLKDVRFCSYDRAGLGWSDARKGQRDAYAIAGQLHGLLAAAGVKVPLLLIGHSLGGLFIRVYAQKYPYQVAGLIFLDASTPATYTGALGKALGINQASLKIFSVLNLADWVSKISGYERLRGHCSEVPEQLRSIAGLYQTDSCIASHDTEERREVSALPEDLTEVSTQPVNVPILVLSEDKTPMLQTPEAIAAWNRIQASMLQLSSRSYRVIAIESDHLLQIDCPGFVTQQVRTFLSSLNGTASANSYGTTTTLACKVQ